MQNKKLIMTIVVVVIVGAGAFFGGKAYEKNSLTKQGLLRSASSASGVGNRQSGGGAGGRAFGGAQGGNGGSNGANGGFVSGDVISKDDKSITVKTRDGGSKIVFFSDSTTVGKSVSGSASDLASGQQVMVSGKTNSDGTLTADNIQIRPVDQQPPQPGQ